MPDHSTESDTALLRLQAAGWSITGLGVEASDRNAFPWQGPVSPGTIKVRIRLLARPTRIAMRTHALIVMVVGIFIAADATKDDLDKLQGTWKSASLIVDGREIEGAQFKGARLEVEGDQYTATIGEQTLKVKLKLDPTRTPKAADMTYRDDSNENRTFKAIYKVEGDTLTFCRPTRPEGQRPTAFAAPADSMQVLIVWKREKP